MQIKWLNRALLNLKHEAEYIAQHDPAAARIVVQRIYAVVNQLVDHPALGRPGRIHGTHELIIPDIHYLIPYRVRPRLKQIEILCVFHTSRRLPKNW